MIKEFTKEQRKQSVKWVIFLGAMVACLTPWIGGAAALFLGILMAWLQVLPLEKYSGWLIRHLLQVAVVGLGFGINIRQALHAGKEGLLFTVCSVFLTLGMGILLGKKMRLSFHSTLLIAAGTAICGGSAIAALAPLLAAKKEDISVSLGIIFLLNAVALLIFPWLGGIFHLSQHQFGLWSAIAIQDTSSVVAAAASYGNAALSIATTVKLERTLWIIPVSLVCLVLLKKEQKKKAGMAGGPADSAKPKIRMPWFILLFFIAMVLSSYFPAVREAGNIILPASKKLLTVTLFFIGTGFTRKAIRSVGMRPLILGLLLWGFIGTLSLVFLLGQL